MKVALVYPVPADNLETLKRFTPYFERYVQTYLLNPPGVHHTPIVAVLNPERPYNPDFYKRWTKIFDGICPIIVSIVSRGLDIGCAQEVAKFVGDPYDFMVFSTSRTYFHRAGWLKRLVEAREKHGEGLYGAVGSYECPNGQPDQFPNPHIRTVLYGCSPRAMQLLSIQFPVVDRQTAHRFEAGKWNFADWFERNGYAVKMVTWTNEWDKPAWRTPANIFRRGDQSNILCWDKHSDHYRDADGEEKRRLERITG